MNAHFSSMKNLPDQAAPRVVDFQHQATIGIDSPGNSGDVASVMLYHHLPALKQIKLTPFLFKWLEPSRLECRNAVQKVFQ